jgi:hypothetical protein
MSDEHHSGLGIFRFSFRPVVIAGSMIPCLATALFVLLVRA